MTYTDQYVNFDLDLYQTLMRTIGALSRLSSNNDAPYINYRLAEGGYMRCVPEENYEDLSRHDNSFDVMLCVNNLRLGVGIKTFLAKPNGRSVEKVAEFNSQNATYKFSSMEDDVLMKTVASLRNKRVISDANAFDIEVAQSFYSCLIREPGVLKIYEFDYPLIDEHNLQLLKSSGATIKFTDGRHFYTFSKSKSVLLKEFNYADLKPLANFDVTIYDDPMELIILFGELLEKRATQSAQPEDPVTTTVLNPPPSGRDTTGLAFVTNTPTGGESPKPDWTSDPIHQALMKRLAEKPKPSVRNLPYVVLPLYSTRKDGKYVPEKSGLNQWAAGGRKREFGESYIPVPVLIRDFTQETDFFKYFYEDDKHGDPQLRCEPFTLTLPNGDHVGSKLCQQGPKALMSEHNVDLSGWLYRIIDGSDEAAKDRFQTRRVYTYQDLVDIGKDSVLIEKLSDEHYRMTVLPIGAYDLFKERIKAGERPLPLSDFLSELAPAETEEDYSEFED